MSARRSWRGVTLAVGLLALLLLAGGGLVMAQSGPLAVSGWTVDGGGEFSSSVDDAYVLTGTIGQPDAGALVGGTYTLAGGFWPATTSPTQPSNGFKVYLPLTIRH